MDNKTTIGQISKVFKTINDNFVDNLFNAAQPIIHSNVLKFLFIILSVFYIFSIYFKKNGSIDISDFWIIVKYLIFFSILLVITSNLDIYKSFLDILKLPNKIFMEIASRVVNGNSEDMFEALKTSMFSISKMETSLNRVLDYFIQIIFFLIALVMLLLLSGVIIFSTFIASVIISLAILVIPCFIIPPWRGIVYGWMKMFISYSMYAPLGILIGGIIQTAGDYSINNLNSGEIGMNSIISIIIIMLMSIFLLTKIPTIVNQIIGSANDNGTGAIGMAMGAKKFGAGVFNTFKNRFGGASSSGGIGGKVGSGIGAFIGGIGGKGGAMIGSKVGGAIGSVVNKIGSKFKQNPSNKNSGAE